VTIVIAAGFGAIGAGCRYLMTSLIQHRSGHRLPVGTTVVNLLGAFALGSITAIGGTSTVVLAATGFLGGFTTFSTWMVESIGLGVVPSPGRWALVNVTFVPIAGFVLAAVGWSMVG
jgi:fluoride exporter